MKIAYDTVLDRPGCALIQASMGADIDNFELAKFGTQSWLLAPTSTMGLYEINAAQLKILQDRVSTCYSIVNLPLSTPLSKSKK